MTTDARRAAKRRYKLRQKGLLPPVDRSIKHGLTGYSSRHKCRCAICKAGWRAWYEAYYAAHSEEIIRRTAAYSRANREHLNERERHRLKNTEAGRRRLDANEARRRKAPLTPEAVEYLAVIADDPCCYCGGPAGSIEHIIPISAGGTSDWDNLARACQSCNSSKRDKPLLLFLLHRATA